ncbi:universal stress protein [Candidatus Neomarinimicrobiota bacterium]
MKFYKRILFPTDFSECSEKGYEYASIIAKTYNAELHIFHADIPYYNFFGPEFKIHSSSKDARSYLLELGKQMDKYVSKYSIFENKTIKRCNTGYATAPTIVDYAKTNCIDLIVMCAYGRRGFRHMLLGSVAEEVIKTSPCHVIIICNEDSIKSVPKHVLVPTDYSSHAFRAVLEGYNITQKLGSDITLLHVIEEPIPSAYCLEGGDEIIDRFYELTAKDAKKKLSDINKDVGIRLNYKIKVIRGHVASSITKYASDNKVDLIVMGSHGHTGLTHFLLGSTTDKVVRSATCPVLIVKQ